MDQTDHHRNECLEAEIRRLRQALRNLSDSVIAGEARAPALALAARELVDPA